MNVYDTANKLASEIKESNEYKGYKALKDEIMANEETKVMLEEFTKVRYEVQVAEYTEGKLDEEKMKSLQERYLKLIEDEKIRNFFELEVKFNILIADVNKIIGEAIKDVL